MKLLEAIEENSQPEAPPAFDEFLIEKIWQDLEGRVSREQIVQVVSEIAAQFQDATITAFVPIFIRRRALEDLNERLENNGR